MPTSGAYESLTYDFFQNIFPLPFDNLLLLDDPAQGQSRFVRVDNIQVSLETYTTTGTLGGTVNATTASDYGSNALNVLIPNTGHINFVIPCVPSEDVLYSVATVPAAGSALVQADGDSNTIVDSMSAPSTAVALLMARESLRCRFKFPQQQARLGLDQSTNPGAIDYRFSRPEAPNPAFMFAVTDNAKLGQITARFEMPLQNLAQSVGMLGRLNFYVGSIAYSPYPAVASDPQIPSRYTPVPCYPIQVGNNYQRGVLVQGNILNTRNPRFSGTC